MFMKSGDTFVFQCFTCGLSVMDPDVERLARFGTLHHKLHLVATLSSNLRYLLDNLNN